MRHQWWTMDSYIIAYRSPWVRPRHELAAYINRATTVEQKTCCRATVASQRVRSTRIAYIVYALDIANCWTCWVTVKSFAISTPSIFMLRLRVRVIPGSGSGSTACRRLCLRSLKIISHDLLQLCFRLFCCAQFWMFASSDWRDVSLDAGIIR